MINQGSIQVSDGGFAILAAPYVENTGFIKADLGTIALAGTNKFTLDLRGDGLINFVVPPEAVEKIKSDGARVGVNNTGTLQARSGQVLISASVATQVVNAAVNMSGVVDASAFAPNGKGGSVLITSEGDINLSGQVNAAGAGSGAGGQIITKAVRADNIAANAMMTAAAGAAAGDQGGQIEVSGHDVLLSGNIDPGAGGTLVVDPPNFTIRNGISGAGPDFIGEKKLEKILQNGVNFVASAANMIIMQDLTDNVLQGGGGNLTLNAGNAIVFNGVNDKIVTGSGNITMTAGAGGIGIAGGFGHTVALVSGGAPGVDQAGNIVLSTTSGGNIRVKNVTIKSSGAGDLHALFSANAGGNFSATGPVDVEVVAKGVGAQTANAQIDITAHDTLTLNGLRAFASASEQGGGGNLAALAGADLTARVVNDQGNASAQAVMGGHSGLRFNALADLTVDATNAIRISGRTLVAATGDIHSVSFANANALASLDGGHINIAELDVQASGLANKVGSDLVHATANLAGDQVIIGGNATVTAFGAAPKAGFVLAVENLDITGNAVNIGGDATARATANNANLGKSASATANLFVTVTHAGSIGTSPSRQRLDRRRSHRQRAGPQRRRGRGRGRQGESPGQCPRHRRRRRCGGHRQWPDPPRRRQSVVHPPCHGARQSDGRRRRSPDRRALLHLRHRQQPEPRQRCRQGQGEHDGRRQRQYPWAGQRPRQCGDGCDPFLRQPQWTGAAGGRSRLGRPRRQRRQRCRSGQCPNSCNRYRSRQSAGGRLCQRGDHRPWQYRRQQLRRGGAGGSDECHGELYRQRLGARRPDAEGPQWRRHRRRPDRRRGIGPRPRRQCRFRWGCADRDGRERAGRG